MLQHTIVELELQLNSTSIDESVLLQTYLGRFVIENKG